MCSCLCELPVVHLEGSPTRWDNRKPVLSLRMHKKERLVLLHAPSCPPLGLSLLRWITGSLLNGNGFVFVTASTHNCSLYIDEERKMLLREVASELTVFHLLLLLSLVFEFERVAFNLK